MSALSMAENLSWPSVRSGAVSCGPGGYKGPAAVSHDHLSWLSQAPVKMYGALALQLASA